MLTAPVPADVGDAPADAGDAPADANKMRQHGPPDAILPTTTTVHTHDIAHPVALLCVSTVTRHLPAIQPQRLRWRGAACGG